MAAPQPGAPSRQSGNLWVKIVVGIVGFFILATVVFFGGCIYLGYRAKKKVDQIQQAYRHNDVAGMVHAIKGDNPAAPAQKLPAWKPAPPGLVSSSKMKIPLLASLRLVVAGNDPLQGDYESIFIVNSVTDQAIHIKASQQYPKPTDIGALVELVREWHIAEADPMKSGWPVKLRVRFVLPSS